MEKFTTPYNRGGGQPTPIIDTRAIVKRHMENRHHSISEEEMRQVTITTSHIDVAQHPLVKALSKHGR